MVRWFGRVVAGSERPGFDDLWMVEEHPLKGARTSVMLKRDLWIPSPADTAGPTKLIPR